MHALQRKKVSSAARRMRGAYAVAAAALASAVLLAPADAAGDATRLLPGDLRVRLERGERVITRQRVEGSDWPAVTIYQIVRASPEEAAAVFTDYGAEASYLASCCGIVQSVVTDPAAGGDPRAQLVFYEQRVPALSSERYVLREVVSRTADGGYAVHWHKAQNGGRAADIVGHAYLEPYGTDTLLVYYNLTVFRRFGASLFAERYVGRTVRTVDAMRARMETLHVRGGASTDPAVSRLRRTLARQ